MTYLQTLIRQYNQDFEIKVGKNAYSVISPIPHENKIERNRSAIYNRQEDTLFDYYHQKLFTSNEVAILYENIAPEAAKIYTDLFTNDIQYHFEIDTALQKQHAVYKHFDPKVLTQLLISITPTGELLVPIVYHQKIIDVRNYKTNRSAKVFNASGFKTATGLIAPYDIVASLPKQKHVIIICEGEKDMIMARTMGLEAICLTGGARRIPEFNNQFFADRYFCIWYDNDRAGEEGSDLLGNFLLEKKAKSVKIFDWKIIKTFRPQNKDDVFNYFTTYQQTKANFSQIYQALPKFKRTKSKIEFLKTVSKTTVKTLIEAKEAQKTLGKIYKSQIQIISSWDQTVTTPSNFILGDQEYLITKKNIEDNLLLLGNAKSQQKTMKELLGVSTPELVSIKSNNALRQYEIFDYLSDRPETAILYTVNEPLEVGQKYIITYKVVSHPLEKNAIVLMAVCAENIEQEADDFVLKPTEKDILRNAFCLKPDQKLEAKMLQFYEDGKKYIGNYIGQDIYFTVELLFHSVLQLKYNNNIIRGCLDILIVGVTRIGKSETVKKLIDLYKKGSIISLKNTTEKGLIGGSMQGGASGKNWKLTIGELTRQHKGLIVMEELQGCQYNPHIAMTDLRSSGILRLVRVGGSLVVPTLNRRLILANPKSSNIDIRQYSSGVKIIQELVGAPEDIARYDLICIADPKEELIDPEKVSKTPNYAQSVYEQKMKWVWSRKPENIVIDTKANSVLWAETLKLNAKFGAKISTVQIMGRETNLKLIRLATAVATMVCSTDENFEKVIVTPEHIQWAAGFFNQLYSNPIFRLDQFIKKSREYLETKPEDFEYLKAITKDNDENIRLLTLFANHDSPFIRKNTILTLWDYKNNLNVFLSMFIQKKFLKTHRDNEYIITNRFRTLLNDYKTKS